MFFTSTVRAKAALGREGAAFLGLVVILVSRPNLTSWDEAVKHFLGPAFDNRREG